MPDFIFCSHLGKKWTRLSIFHVTSSPLFGTKPFPDGTKPLPKMTLWWRHNEHDGVSNHQPHDCLLNCLFRHRSKKTSKLCVTGLCEGNSQVTDEFPTQKASNVENSSIWWRHYEYWLIISKIHWHSSDMAISQGIPQPPIAKIS